MMQANVKHVPWTCRWGRFGGPVNADVPHDHGFVFWVCGHPETTGPRVLDRSSCDRCVRWEKSESYQGETDS